MAAKRLRASGAATDKGVRVTFELDLRDIADWWLGVPQPMREAISNLLRNPTKGARRG